MKTIDKITAAILMISIIAGAVSTPMTNESNELSFNVIASADSATKWNGTSTMKSGEKYAITSEITMDSKFTVPKKTTLIIYDGGRLTISKGVTATLDGKISVSKGGSLNVDGTLICSENSTLSISGKLTYSASAKLKINGKYTVSDEGSVSGSGSEEINLSVKSQYNSDMDKVNSYLSKGKYSKACSLLENAISAYPDKKPKLQKAYSSAVIDWADDLADSKDYSKACSVLKNAMNYLSDTKNVENRYNFYKSYIPVPLHSMNKIGGKVSANWTYNTDSFGYKYDNSLRTYSDRDGYYHFEYRLDSNYTNFDFTLAAASRDSDGSNYCQVYADGKLIYTSPELNYKTKAIDVKLDITGAETIAIYAMDQNSITSNRYPQLIVANAVVYKE